MSNWFSRWFDKPKSQTVLRATPAPNPPVQAPADAAGITDWKPGDLILGEYRVARELGHGSMGAVYLVVNAQSTDLRFAVKKIHVAGDVYRRNFLVEIQTWIGLSEHPHLVACRFFRTVGEELVIFAEYVEGATLSRWIEDKRLSRIQTLLDIAIQFAWGLHAAHEQGVIHQDVKPSNALIAVDGTVKVTDFGLARAQATAAQRTEGDFHDTLLVAHAGGMTDEYCSPEQAQDQPLSRRSDLWSWGVSVLEMFTGKVTWRSGLVAAQALDEFLKAQASGATPAEGRPRMPDSVAAVLRRCLPARRSGLAPARARRGCASGSEDRRR
ncbi:MAG: serine/threonine-protein kinase [Burkholderiales bacterium]